MKVIRACAVVLGMAQSGYSKPFSYLDNSTDEYYGIEDWDLVEKSDYYFNWDRFYKRTNVQNECQWRTNQTNITDFGHTQSPIDLDDWNDCDLETDDTHRPKTYHGDCEWKDLNWTIRPWGLEMSFPMPRGSNVNPERTPCDKPHFDSSGGYGEKFYMNYLIIKTPGEHTLKGEKFQAEIQMGFFRYEGSDPSIFGGPPYTVHTLVEAGYIEEDNFILQPYLDKWQEEHDRIYNACARRFGPNEKLKLGTASPTLSPTTFTSNITDFAPTPSSSNITDSAPSPVSTNVTASALRGMPTNRRLDHEFIWEWNKGRPRPFSQLSTVQYWDPFRLWTSPWFIRYRGSLTMPQCFDDTRVRVHDRALQISQRQLIQIETLIAQMRDPLTCKLATVGKPRGDTGFVDVNRPLQQRNKDHELKYCDSGDFSQKEFYTTPRGNSCWCLLTGECPEGCEIDCAGNCIPGGNCDEHWRPDQRQRWEAIKCPRIKPRPGKL